MKKSIFASMLLASIVSFASYQYNCGDFAFEVVEQNYKGKYAKQTENVIIRVTKGSGTIFIADYVSTLNGNNKKGELADYVDTANVNYGWVDMKANDGVLHQATGGMVELSEQRKDIQNAYALGEFSAGDEFAVYIDTNKNGIMMSGWGEDTVNTADFKRGEFGQHKDAWHEPVLRWDTNMHGRGSSDHIMLVFGGQNDQYTTFGVDPVLRRTNVGGDDVPVGQPLPGVLASLAVGAAVIKLRNRKRKN